MQEKEKKIIVIEDDRDINELISYNLLKNGFAVTSVHDGTRARESLESDIFDVVILDIMLPGIDGFNLCKEIKARQSAFKTFVIVVSAKADTQDKLYAHILGADYYLAKPFEVSTLVEIAKELSSFQENEFAVIVDKIAKGGEK